MSHLYNIVFCRSLAVSVFYFFKYLLRDNMNNSQHLAEKTRKRTALKNSLEESNQLNANAACIKSVIQQR